MAREAGQRDAAVTVCLRPVNDEDEAWLRSWMPDVAAQVGYDIDIAAMFVVEPKSALEVLVIERDAAAAGVIVFRTDTPAAGSAIIEFVATPPELARRGAGMQAMAGLEQALRQRRVRRIYAPAPDRHGIAVYFWIRLGYRPLLRDEWPCERAGVAWLARDLPPA